MLFRKTKRGDRYRIAMRPRALTASSRARPVEHGCGSYFSSVKEKSNRSLGSRGLAPSGCLPTGGERGSPSQFLRQSQKTESIISAIRVCKKPLCEAAFGFFSQGFSIMMAQFRSFFRGEIGFLCRMKMSFHLFYDMFCFKIMFNF